MVVNERMPTTCPYGHRLGPRRVLVGWHPCQCRPGLVEAHRGHRIYQCLACRNRNWTTICYLPYHLTSGARGSSGAGM